MPETGKRESGYRDLIRLGIWCLGVLLIHSLGIWRESILIFCLSSLMTLGFWCSASFILHLIEVSLFEEFGRSLGLGKGVVYLLFCTGGTVFYWVHRLGHGLFKIQLHPQFQAVEKFFSGLSRNWWKAHFIGHHREVYPPDKFHSKVFLHHPTDPYLLSWFAYIVPGGFILLVAELLGRYCLTQFTFIFGVFYVWLMKEEFIHRALHTNAYHNFIMDGLNRAHQLHHSLGSTVNFGVANLMFDFLFGTLKE